MSSLKHLWGNSRLLHESLKICFCITSTGDRFTGISDLIHYIWAGPSNFFNCFNSLGGFQLPARTGSSRLRVLFSLILLSFPLPLFSILLRSYTITCICLCFPFHNHVPTTGKVLCLVIEDLTLTESFPLL